MAKFRVTVNNQSGRHSIALHNGAQSRSLEIAPKPDGYGSSLSGGELLFLALATCYCNDIYREASKRGIPVERVEVEVEGDFEREGGPASNITYRARVKAQAGREDLLALMRHTDQVAEIQNTLRTATTVELRQCEVIE